MRELNEITQIIIGKAIEVHKALGPGLLEPAYQKCLAYELRMAGLEVQEEKPVPLLYKEVKLEQGYRIDLLVEDRVVVELKSVEKIMDVHQAQVLTQLKLGGYKVGLLINFNVTMLKHGLKRFMM